MEYKRVAHLPPNEQMICSTPDVVAVVRDPGDEFLLLACDGVWDVMSNQQAVDFVHERLGVGCVRACAGNASHAWELRVPSEGELAGPGCATVSSGCVGGAVGPLSPTSACCSIAQRLEYKGLVLGGPRDLEGALAKTRSGTRLLQFPQTMTDI